MHARPRSVERLIEALGRLPGVGPKTSERLAYFLLRAEPELAEELAAAIRRARESTRVCSVCCNLDESDPCGICADEDRDRGLLLVVEDPRDVTAFEAAGYRGLYHVLQGRLSGLEGIGLDDLTLEPLLRRVASERPREVCLATNPDLEGEGTAQLLAERLSRPGMSVTRLARGMPAGSTIIQVSQSILADAMEGRRPLS
jgi:recombination protein RecR